MIEILVAVILVAVVTVHEVRGISIDRKIHGVMKAVEEATTKGSRDNK
jgi:hypothetical protein